MSWEVRYLQTRIAGFKRTVRAQWFVIAVLLICLVEVTR